LSTVLVVDDKEMMRDSVCSVLRRAGITALAASSGQEALDRVALQRPDAVVSDLKMPGMTGVELLAQVRTIDEELPVVLMTAFGSVQTAVEAMKLGAFDYLTKPFEGDELLICVKRAIQHARLRRENAVLRAQGEQAQVEPGGAIITNGQAFGLDRLVGASPAMRSVKAQAQAVADSHGTVLIVGQSGTGKEVVARAIHELSPRRTGPFLAVNCAALSETLLESELFGHEKGAFTGADKMRKGRFELAHGGTLLLDEVSEVSPAIQAKLLRVLQERAFERVGSSQSISVDVRVLATSNRDLPKAVAAGDFRQDLFFRLNVLPIHLPALIDRVEDVPVLAEAFLGQIAKREGRGRVRLEPRAVDLLCRYSWPGNVRELQNVCERAVVLSATGARRDDVVIKREMIEPWLVWQTAPVHDQARALPARVRAVVGEDARSVPEPALAGTVSSESSRDAGEVVQVVEPGGSISFAPGSTTLEDMERDAIIRTLERYQGHRQRSADALGIGVRTLGIKLKRWKDDGLVPTDL